MKGIKKKGKVSNTIREDIFQWNRSNIEYRNYLNGKKKILQVNINENSSLKTFKPERKLGIQKRKMILIFYWYDWKIHIYINIVTLGFSVIGLPVKTLVSFQDNLKKKTFPSSLLVFLNGITATNITRNHHELINSLICSWNYLFGAFEI